MNTPGPTGPGINLSFITKSYTNEIFIEHCKAPRVSDENLKIIFSPYIN